MIGLIVCVGLTIADEPGGALAARGGVATFAGNFTGLVGTYLALVMVLLVSRISFIERVLGTHRLLNYHRRLGPWPITLITAHAVLIVIGYAQAARSGVGHEIDVLILSYPDMLAATVALGLMLLAGTTSIRALRSRLRRETWWTVHLYLYLALALSFAHVIVLGPSFVGHPLTRIVWSVAWAATAGTVLWFRVGLPVARSLRHGLRVVSVQRETPEVVSIVCAGRRVERLAVSGGQFFSWRFMTRGMWWQAHPYSLSALPRPPHLRLTVKAVGDHSAAVAGLRPGTRVLIEGPYGSFNHHAQRQPKVLLLAGGIGVTALRALLEDLPRRSEPVVIVRASSEEQVVFREELDELVRIRKGKLYTLIGSRERAELGGRELVRLVPDLRRRDVFVCGPEGFVTSIVAVLESVGVPKGAIHHEAYSLLPTPQGQPVSAQQVRPQSTARSAMRRAPFVFAATLAGLAVVLGFRTSPSASSVAVGGTRSSGPGPTATTNSSPASSASRRIGPAAPAVGGAQTTATGKAEQYGYGSLTVRVTVSGGKIVAIAVPALQTAEQYSQQLAVQVIPTLRSQVLSAQSARINGVSGATYTSEAYALSLQSALDKLHFR